jgi:hypothetical protein
MYKKFHQGFQELRSIWCYRLRPAPKEELLRVIQMEGEREEEYSAALSMNGNGVMGSFSCRIVEAQFMSYLPRLC